MKDMIQSLSDHILVKVLIALGDVISSFLFGEWTQLLTILGVFLVIDFTTGWIAAIHLKQLSSKIGAIGILKKLGMVLVVAMAHWMDTLLGTDNIFRDGCIWFYLANEGLSITENLTRSGVPVPSVIRKALSIIESKSEKADQLDK
ncbi:phage holin family protein [Hazenella sp. IB182357]|uniref:Phage holin family protein n=1 Tax=Polycladospora coralii TaxID=2771432 RepID=A0A926NBY0_9BACL|nr:phage holin family protein [Polycladospora coralii]MBD1373437.1 phage holin family protein [Polycladospora coralii]MBS7531215.1 phage holin family protein [Polycladospora coralii]